MEISFKRYSSSDGLPDNSVRCVYFDSKGFLWIGTEEGLARFDGEEFIKYSRSTSSTNLSGSVITDIEEDEEGNLWLATQDGGICHFNPQTNETYHPILPSYGGSEQNRAYALWLNPKGGMVVGTDKGIYISKDRKTFQLYSDKEYNSCYALTPYHGGVLTAENRYGVHKINQEFSFQHLMDTATIGLSGGLSLNSIYVDMEGRFWLAAWNNFLHELIPSQKMLKSTDITYAGKMTGTQDELRCITEASSGQLWIGMKSGQLWQYDKKTKISKLLPISNRDSGKIYGNKIQCLYTDKYGRTWIGTNNGLHVYDSSVSRFEVKFLEAGTPVTSFERIANRMFAGSFSNLYEIDGNNIKNLLNGVRIYSMLAYSADYLLLGTDNSIRAFDINTNKVFYPLKLDDKVNFAINNLTSSRYNFLYKPNSHSHDFYANAYGYGVVHINESFQWKIYQILNQDGYDNLLNGMFQDSKDRLWIFGSLTGLMTDLSKDKNKYFKNENAAYYWLQQTYNEGLQSKNITALAELDDGTMWASTLGGGLYEFNPDSESIPFRLIPTPFQSVRNMIRDENNTLWMVSSGALMNYNPGQNKWTVYDELDGIPKEGLNGSLYFDIDGSLYAGGNGFLMHFHPATIDSGHEKPQTRITHLKVMDIQRDDLLAKRIIHLPYENNFVSIDFTSLCFSNASSSTFKYKMIGVDNEWRDNGTINSVSYSTLSPGEYQFHVKAISAEGIQDAEGAILTFVVASPFYSTWWFLTLIILALVIIVWIVLRARRRQALQLELVRNKIARDLHDDIGSALGSISFFSETAKRTLYNKQNDNTALVLDKIGATSREMIENMHDIVWAVDPLNDSFDHVTERMKSYAADVAAANNIKLNFTEKDGLSSLKLSMTERKNLFLIFKEALYNSVKYSDCTNIKVIISPGSKSYRLSMVISDNGKGFDIETKAGKGNGLKNMKGRANEINASFSIHSDDSTGTVIKVSLK